MDEPNERSPLTIVCEYIFLGSSTILIADRAWAASRLLCLAYLTFLILYAIKMVRITPPRGTGSPSPLAIINAFAFTTIVLARVANGSPSAAIMAAAAGPTGHKEISVPSDADNGIPRLPTIKDPMAKDAQKICPGYLAKNVKKSDTGITATLQLNGKHCQAYGNDIDTLALSVSYQAKDRLNVKIQPASIPDKEYWWYILPEFFTPSPPTEPGQGNATLNNDLSFFWNNDPTFNFRVVRDSTGDVLFDTSGTKIVYEDQFIEFVTHMPANYNLYGLGETIHGFRLGNNFTKTIFASDTGDPIDGNIYSSHPVYIDTRYFQQGSDKKMNYVDGSNLDPQGDYVAYSHGLYNRNAHAQEILMSAKNVTWRATGGSIDLYFYSGDTASEVISSYQSSAPGLPAMQQYWTFGYHQCRWGYRNWTQLQGVVDNFAKFSIPLETIWTDIDYMKTYRDFDNDPDRFGYAEGQKFLDGIHKNNQHYVPIVDAAIYVPNANNASDAYPPFDRGNATNSFLLNPDGSLYIGDVWPGFTAFPDWLSGSGANEWWANEFQMWHNKINWSGIWLDMNEVSSFCVGSCGSKNLSQNPVSPPFSLPGDPGSIPYGYPEGFANTNASEAASASAASSSQDAANSKTQQPSPTTTSYLRTTPTPGHRLVNYPPYVINNDQGDIAVHAVAPNATHHNGVQEYDVHNLWGHGEINATYNALLKVFPGKRPFIIARSTFVGSGQKAGHWGGDNTSLFYYMYASISQALQHSIFGIPMFGVDTCGFQGNTDEELCSRWMQLSAFFPFYRNHNDLASIPQEPYNWGGVIQASKTAMGIRYQLLPYIYTLMEQAHQTGSTVMSALAWEYPNDPTLANADRQFFLGPAILVTPVLIQGMTTVNGVFPGSGRGEIYYDWYNQTQVQGVGKSQNVTIAAPLGHIPVFVRGGYVVPMQQAALTTEAARNSPWSVLVPLSQTGAATGSLYLDDGQSVAPPSTRTVKLAATKNSLSSSSTGNYVDSNKLANVTVLGVGTAPKSVTFNGKPVSGHTYDAEKKVLVIKNLDSSTPKGAWTQDWTLKWQ